MRTSLQEIQDGERFDIVGADGAGMSAAPNLK